LPQFRWTHCRHEDFLRASTVQLVADNRFDFANDTKTKREKIVNASGNLADHASANEQLVTHHFRFSRIVAKRRNKHVTIAHEGIE
jgi:hypothetical protein